MIYFALASDGYLYDLCDCGDFEAAEESAEDLGLDVIWIIDEVQAQQWSVSFASTFARTISQRPLK